jgi:GNAT superfamily N-acetyltransferase
MGRYTFLTVTGGMMLTTRLLSGDALSSAIDDIAQLRITVFRDWPYLYDGALDYERDYLSVYLTSPRSVVVGAFDGTRLIGAATGTPMEDHAEDFAAAFRDTNLDLSKMFYCAESVLLSAYRGQGIGHQFFDQREAHARDLGFETICFCAVQRPVDHPLRPVSYRPLDAFWQKRGYTQMPGVVAYFDWKDIDKEQDTNKALQFWSRTL